MTSQDDTNNTLEDNMDESLKNLIIALNSYKPPEKKPAPEYRAIYDPTTMLVTHIGIYNSDSQLDKPYVVLTNEEFMASNMGQHKIEDGKMVKFHTQTTPPNILQLVPGNKWQTTKENMLIMGKEVGWDARNNN